MERPKINIDIEGCMFYDFDWFIYFTQQQNTALESKYSHN